MGRITVRQILRNLCISVPDMEAALYNNTLYLYQPGTDPETEGGWAIKDNNTLETAFFNVWGLQEAREDIFGNRTTYAYDTDLRLQAVITPSGKRYAISLDGEGHLSALTDRQGVTTAYTYDAGGRILTETRQDGAQRRYSYTEAFTLGTA